MSEVPVTPAPRPAPVLVRLAILASSAGALVSLLLFLRPGPYSLVVFMFVGQPLLLAGIGAFALQVLYDLKRTRLL